MATLNRRIERLEKLKPAPAPAATKSAPRYFGEPYTHEDSIREVVELVKEVHARIKAALAANKGPFKKLGKLDTPANREILTRMLLKNAILDLFKSLTGWRRDSLFCQVEEEWDRQAGVSGSWKLLGLPSYIDGPRPYCWPPRLVGDVPSRIPLPRAD
jgi:hypothetical protein